MFAVIAVGGKQYRVIKGEYLVVDRQAVEEGATFSPVVVLASDGKQTAATEDACKGVQVSARVREHKLGPKINIRTDKAKKSSSRRMGYRSRQSVIEIESITFAGKSTPSKEAENGA